MRKKISIKNFSDFVIIAVKYDRKEHFISQNINFKVQAIDSRFRNYDYVQLTLNNLLI